MAKTKLYYKDGIAYYKAGGRFHALSSNALPKAQGGLFISADDATDPFTGKPHPPHTIYTNDKNNPLLQMYNDSLLAHRTGSIDGKWTRKNDYINNTTNHTFTQTSQPVYGDTPLGHALYRLKKANQRIPVMIPVQTGYEHRKPTHPVVLIGSNTNNTSTTPVDYSKTPAGRLIALGMPASFNDRAKYAKELGINGFSGTPEQNAAIADAMETKARDKVFKKDPTKGFTDTDSEEADYPQYNYGGSLPKAQVGTYTWGTGNVSAPASTVQNTESSSVNKTTPSKVNYTTYEGRTFPETEIVASRSNDPDLVLRNPIDTLVNDYKNKLLGLRPFPIKKTIGVGQGYLHNNAWMSLNMDLLGLKQKGNRTGIAGHLNDIMSDEEMLALSNPTLYLIKKNLSLPNQKQYDSNLSVGEGNDEVNYINKNIIPKGYTYQELSPGLIRNFTPENDTLLGSVTLTPEMWKQVYDSKTEEEAKRKLFKMADVSPEEEKNFDNTFIHMNLNNPKQFNTYKKVQKRLPNTNWDDKAKGGYLPKAQTSMDLGNLPMPTITGTQIPVNPVAIQTGPMPPPPKGPGVGDWMKGNPSAVAGIGTAASSLLSNFGNQNKNNAQDPTVGKIMKGYGDSGLSDTLSTGLDAASSLDPTGTTAFVNAISKVGKGVGNLVKNENEYGVSQSGAQEVIGNVFDPIGKMQQSLNIGKKHGFVEGLKDFATFGYTGNKLMEEDQKRGEDRVDYKGMAERQGLNKGNYRNDSVYAKRGVNLQSQPLSNKKKPNVEIEDGEILLGNPGSTTKYGNVTNSLTSKFATKFHGDKHGEDTDKDGMEGIPLNSDSGYIASNFLGMDGRKVNKQNGGKTVADEMTPLIDYLHQTEQNSQDAYRNNPVAIKEVLRQLEGMKNTAEVNKFRVELEKMIKNQEIPLEEVFAFIQQNAPTDDMSPEQLQGLEGMMPQPEQGGMAQGPGGPQQQTQGDPQDIMAMIAQQAGAAQQQGGMPPMPQQAKNGLNMYNRYNRFQQGGPMPGQEQEQNPSSNRMMELMGQAQGQMGNQGSGEEINMATNPALAELNPEVQQMFAQLPPEMQEQILQLPPDQVEIAIMNAIEQMQGGQQPQQGMPPMEGQMDPAMMEQQQAAEEQAMMAEQQALMQLGGYTNEYFGDKFRDKNKVAYTPSQDPRAANAHLPRPVQLEGHFNPQTKTHMKQMGAFQDNYQTGGAIDSRMVEMVQQLVQQGYSPEQAIQVAQQKLAQEAPEKKMGGMVGKTVKFKMGGRLVQGTVESVDKNGNFTLR